MRRCELIALAVAIAGCNSVLGIEETVPADAAPTSDSPPPDPDLDRDGMLDADDPCIATSFDAQLDSEGDAQENSVDDCPFDATDGPDVDGDGIQDACDPFRAVGGDRIRCVMAMSNPGLNARLWRERPGNTAWNYNGPGITASGDGTVVATAVIDAPVSTSFDVYGSIFGGATTPASFTMWLRTGVTPSPSDVGCEVRGNATAGMLSIVHGGAPITQPFTRSFAGVIRMRATLEPGAAGTTVRCELAYTAYLPLAVPPVTGAVLIPEGRIGFSVVSGSAGISGITIMERAMPAL